ncbi:hypothetical protein QA600_06610 [Natronococcus sp. A-GB1]|uniref:hypothetical protein n=1 Tax=Natronococcus sp. A-GB1 TaxID=3037648 RepID=UPI00241FCC4E|nr:hypothetical protein [Natronococcus sp. A-GB1]MDG5759009.1 hypothetical protein [Natronococcus sp. A-GB1]
MRAARFVTLCFLYSGLIFIAQFITVYSASTGVSTELGALAQLGVGLSIFAGGLVRLWKPKEEQKPTEYGFMAYGMAVLSVFLTVIFLAQLLLL